MRKRVLILTMVLLSFCMTMQAQDTETKGRRTFWFGFNGDFGAINLHMSDGLLDGIYGLTLNSAISINNLVAVGPYVSFNIFNEDPAPFAGLITKLTFTHNWAVFGGYGVGFIGQDYYARYILMHQIRLGIKFPHTFFLTGSYLFGEYRGATIGLGFSFGGKPKKR